MSSQERKTRTSPREKRRCPIDAVAARLRAEYGFDEVVVGRSLNGGFANDLFHVVADGRDLVLRIQLPPADHADVAWEHRLTRALAARLPEVVAPIATRDGATSFDVDGRLAWLMALAEGAPADPDREEHRVAAAAALGRLHLAGTDLAMPPRPRLEPLAQLEWPETAVPAELAGWEKTIASTRAWAIAFVARLAARRRLPLGLVHGDFFPGNVLIADDGVTALIDWEEAQLDWLTWDLACAVGTFCSRADRLDEAACSRFVGAYRAAGGTARADDDDLLVPLLRVKRTLEVLRAPTDREPRWDHQRLNLRSMEHLRAAPAAS